MGRNREIEGQIELGASADRLFVPEGVQVDLDLVAEPTTQLTKSKRVYPSLPDLSRVPRKEFGPAASPSECGSPTAEEDPELYAVATKILQQDPRGERFAYALREALDQVYDGRRTGRWDFTQLSKTEKTHIGTLVEIWLQREFQFLDGKDLDYRIGQSDVDCKWSRQLYGWEIPIEMYSRGNKIALLVWANEYTAKFAVGLIRVSERVLKPMGQQRDRKRTLSLSGRRKILWVHQHSDMIKNTLIHHPEVARKMRDQRSGQKAVDTIFRELQGELINHATVETAAQQIDSSKRVRDSRHRLAPEGILIFGHYAPHPDMAEALGLPRPTLSRFVSCRVIEWRSGDLGDHVCIEGTRWKIAAPTAPVVMAPSLPAQGRAST